MGREFFTVTKDGATKRVLGGRQREAALAAGWTDSGTRRVTTEAGERTVESGEAVRRVESGEAEGFVSEDVIDRRRGDEFIDKRFGKSGIQTFGESGVSALTFGLADPLLEGIAEISEGDSGSIAARQKANPGAATAGAITGTVVGALGAGLAGNLGRAARLTPAGRAAAVATRGGKAVRAATGSRAAGVIAEGALDGAFFGAGQQFANAALNDTELTAEQVISELPSNALFGAATGGAFVGISKLANRIKVKKAAVNTSDDIAKGIKESLETQVASRRLTAIDQGTDAAAATRVSDNIQTGNYLSMSPGKFNKFADDVSTLRLDPPQINPKHAAKFDTPILDASGALTELGEQMHKLGMKPRAVVADPATEALARTYAIKKMEAAAVEKTASSSRVGSLLNPLGGRAGAVLGNMRGAVGNVKSKISDGIKTFARVAGKPRRGNVPAASTILGKIKFDADLGKKPKGRKEQFKAVAKQINDLGNNPDLLKTRIEASTAEMRTLHPSLGDKIMSKAMQKFQYMHRLLPRSPHGSTGFGPDRWSASSTEVDKYARIMAAAENPSGIIDDLNSGKLTQEAVDTVKTLYPEIYVDIQMEIIENIDDIKANVDYQGRLQLGLLFQVPTDVVLEPAFIQRMQTNYMQRDQEREQQGTGGFSTPGAAQQSVTAQQTASQRLESK